MKTVKFFIRRCVSKVFRFNQATLLVLLIVFHLAGAIKAQAYEYLWVGGPSGIWSDPANWAPSGTGPFPPDYPHYGSDKVFIDGDPGQNTTVTVDGDFLIGPRMAIDAGDAVTIGNGRLLQFYLWGLPQTIIATLSNDGLLILNSTGAKTTLKVSWSSLTLTGSGNLILGGNLNNTLTNYNGSFINDSNHTIRGGGTIECSPTLAGTIIFNNGNIIADNGTLRINSTIDNGGIGIVSVSGDNNILEINGSILGGRINPGTGRVEVNGWIGGGAILGAGTVNFNDPSGPLRGVTFDTGCIANIEANIFNFNDMIINPGAILNISDNHSLASDHWGTVKTATNNGTINLNSSGNPTTFSYLNLTGSGNLVMGGNINNILSGYLTNDTNHIIRGGGTIDAAITNLGNIIADNGTLKVNQPITGTGNISAQDQGLLFLNRDVSIQNFSMTANASLEVGPARVDVSGNFLFAVQDKAHWVWGQNSVLRMTGTGPDWHFLEAGGIDFIIPNLIIAGNIALVDLDHNSAGPGREALYVNHLTVSPGATLNLNTLQLYCYLNGNLHQVSAGEGALFGGGQIINRPLKPIALPFLLLLLGD